MINEELLYKFLKYAAIGSAFFLILKWVPAKQQLDNQDIVLIVVISLLICVLVETILNYKNNKSNNGSKSKNYFNTSDDPTSIMCQSMCARSSKEHLDGDISKPIQPTNTGLAPNSGLTNTSLAPNSGLTNTGSAPNSGLTNGSAPNSGLANGSTNSGSPNTSPLILNLGTSVTQEAPIDCKLNPELCVPRSDLTREKNGVIKNEMQYNSFNNIPLPDNYNTGSFEYGYSFLPPEKWYPTPPNPPVCVTDKECPVCPSYTIGTPMNLKEWDESRRITQPDNMNVKYITEKLNSGR